MQTQQKAIQRDNKHSIEYYKKLGSRDLVEGIDLPNFEIVKVYKMVKNAICIKTPFFDGFRYIVKHYDTKTNNRKMKELIKAGVYTETW